MSQSGPLQGLPNWVPTQSCRYLAHVETGRSIRDLARSEGCHPSTILRQIRRLESRRDDPLVDEALKQLGHHLEARDHIKPTPPGRGPQRKARDMTNETMDLSLAEDDMPSDAELSREALRILRRLCETGAVLALAADMEKAVVVRDGPGGSSTRTAVVDRPVAQAMALKEWISCAAPGRISRYAITPTGRSALGRLMAEQENDRVSQIAGFADAPAQFRSADKDTAGRRGRYAVSESPLYILSRRKDRDGHPFLDETLVAAGERLREDFELAQLRSDAGQNWERMLTGGARGSASGSGVPQLGQSEAQDRVLAALKDLGPGLADVALRCCCFVEGLELAEKRLGWSARSGKIVLRIALQQLKRHYATQTEQAQMIG